MVMVDLEDVRTILKSYEGQTLYPMMISNIMVEIRKKSQEKPQSQEIDKDKNPFL